MKRKRLARRRIFWGLALVVLASTPLWVNFGALSAKISALFDHESPAQNEAHPPPVVEKKPSKETLRAKVNELLKKEGDILPGTQAEIIGVLDLNNDGVWEVVVTAEAGGAYTMLFAVMEYRGGKVALLNLVDRDGEQKKARFLDGSSVRHANAFKILNDKRDKAYVQLTGESDDTGAGWTWDIAAYSWSRGAFRYNRTLSEKIAAGDPQEFFREEDYLDKLFQGN
ncbi:MAG: hypothetical protein AAB846_00435 [Patescibacteria group bacterium]